MEKQEKNIPVVLDHLDFDPNALFGFTISELGMCMMVLFFACLFPLVALCQIIGINPMFGAIAAAALGLVLSFAAAKRAEILKKGRPSYMLWIDLKRRLQDEGIFGLKYNFGLVKSMVWDNTKKQKRGAD